MTDDELAAVIAAAALLSSRAVTGQAEPRPAWRLAARLGTSDAGLARVAARAASVWSIDGRLRG